MITEGPWLSVARRFALLTVLLPFLAVIAGGGFVVAITTNNIHDTIKQAEGGDATSQCQLGYLYQTGIYSTASLGLVHKDRNKAVYWYQKAAKQGNDDAYYRLGTLYESDHTRASDRLALQWYIIGAKRADSRSINELIAIYTTGRLGQPIDQQKAYYWQTK